MTRDKPILAAALLCERVLEEKDGVNSLIRCIDRIVVQAQGQQVPGQMPSIPVSVWAFISFKSGSARGRFSVTLVPRTPSGFKLAGPTIPLLFEGEDDRGINIKLLVNFQAQDKGLYWFDVVLDDEVISRMPLRLVYQPMSLNQPPQL